MTSPPPKLDLFFRYALPLAALFGALSVICGALGAHVIPPDAPEGSLRRWQTAVRYHQIHAVVLFVLAYINANEPNLRARIPIILFATGLILFCGSLYMLVLGGPSGLAKLTPIGGLAFIAGWISCAFLLRKKPSA